jgi:YidC/Oxa1 family membrane protein insertase
MAYSKNAFSEFDVIHVINNAQKKEVEYLNLKKNKKIKIFSSKYILFNKNILINKNLKNKKVLIAPTWNTDFYELKLHIILADLLYKNKISFEFRPHYMSFVKNEINDKIFEKLNIIVNRDLNLNYNTFENLISDWSGIYFEFAYFKKRKPILINTSKKIRNLNYSDFLLEPIEITARKIIGNTVDVKDINSITNILLKKDQNEKYKIDEYFKNNFFL